MKNYEPSNAAKLIGLVTSDEPSYPQTILASMKRASIATAWGISESTVNSIHVLLAFAMHPTMSRTAAHSIIATTQLIPCLSRPLHLTILPLLWDQSIQYPPCWQIDSPLLLDKPSMDLVTLV